MIIVLCHTCKRSDAIRLWEEFKPAAPPAILKHINSLTTWRLPPSRQRGLEQKLKKKQKKKTEEVHINIGQSPASYKKCRVQSKLKVSMRNFNALWRAGPFEVDRWRQKHELNIKGSIKMLDSQSLGRCKGGINQFLCQAGGVTPAVLVVSRQTQTASQTAGQL